MINRENIRFQIEKCLKEYPVTFILGPRQCGKTTLARTINEIHEGTYFDLEDPGTALQPERANIILSALKGLVIMDECQRQPGTVNLLRVLSDRKNRTATFLLTGSASPSLVRGASESMAGRVAYVNLGGFNISELKMEQSKSLWLRGGLPLSFLGRNNFTSYEWRKKIIYGLW